MKWELPVVLGIVVLGGCNASLEPGEPPADPEYHIAFEPPFQSDINVMLGGSGQVHAKVLDRRGRLVTPDEGPTYRSTNPATVTVDASGHFTAVGWNTGSAAIVAEARISALQLSKSISVFVVCTLEIRIALSPTSVSLAVGERFTPSMSLSTCGGQVPINSTVTWSASDPSILSVNAATGETTALKSGSAYVQGAASPSGVVGSISVTVH